MAVGEDNFGGVCLNMTNTRTGGFIIGKMQINCVSFLPPPLLSPFSVHTANAVERFVTNTVTVSYFEQPKMIRILLLMELIKCEIFPIGMEITLNINLNIFSRWYIQQRDGNI